MTCLPGTFQGSWGQHGDHLGPTGPRWAPRWPHELCYLCVMNLWHLWVWWRDIKSKAVGPMLVIYRTDGPWARFLSLSRIANVEQVSANEKRHYICNAFSYWPRPCQELDRKWTQLPQNAPQRDITSSWPCVSLVWPWNRWSFDLVFWYPCDQELAPAPDLHNRIQTSLKTGWNSSS